MAHLVSSLPGRRLAGGTELLGDELVSLPFHLEAPQPWGVGPYF